MKLFKKMAVLAAALMLVSVFVSCDNNAEEAGDGIVAEFYGYSKGKYASLTDFSVPKTLTAEAKEPVAKVTFYDDDTFKLSYDSEFIEWMESSRAAATFVEIANGTYEGDPSKDGKVKISVEEVAGNKNELEEASAEAKKFFNRTIEIIDDEFAYADFYFVRVSEKE